MAIIKIITPSVTDANITTAKVTDNAITLAKMASGTDGNIISYDASGNPVAIATGSDGQVLTSTGAGSPPAFETLAAGGITVGDQWRITADVTSNSSPIASNFDQIDSANYGQGTLGSAMTESSGVFTFPSTGIYHVTFAAKINTAANDSVQINIQGTINNSSYDDLVSGFANSSGSSTAYTNTLFDCQATATHKVRFTLTGLASGSSLRGGSSVNTSYITFIRLGDT